MPNWERAITHNKQKAPSSPQFCQTLPAALMFHTKLSCRKLSFTSFSDVFNWIERQYWQWGMLVTECGENVLYTYDTVVRTHKSCHFAKRLVYLAAHPPEEHKARPSQWAFLNKCKTRVCTHKRTCWGICKEMGCEIYNLSEAR